LQADGQDGLKTHPTLLRASYFVRVTDWGDFFLCFGQGRVTVGGSMNPKTPDQMLRGFAWDRRDALVVTLADGDL
jgi:hypothetical protein